VINVFFTVPLAVTEGKGKHKKTQSHMGVLLKYFKEKAVCSYTQVSWIMTGSKSRISPVVNIILVFIKYDNFLIGWVIVDLSRKPLITE
jgi:hypothetical protein